MLVKYVNKKTAGQPHITR
jgi:hypothetical protein